MRTPQPPRASRAAARKIGPIAGRGMSGVTFSAQEFDILWSSLRLGTMPYPLAVSSHGRTLEERAEIRSAVYGRLAGRGLAADGLLERSIADQFGVLGRPEIAVDAVGLTDAPLRALAVSARGTAVLADGVHRD